MVNGPIQPVNDKERSAQSVLDEKDKADEADDTRLMREMITALSLDVPLMVYNLYGRRNDIYIMKEHDSDSSGYARPGCRPTTARNTSVSTRGDGHTPA